MWYLTGIPAKTIVFFIAVFIFRSPLRVLVQRPQSCKILVQEYSCVFSSKIPLNVESCGLRTEDSAVWARRIRASSWAFCSGVNRRETMTSFTSFSSILSLPLLFAIGSIIAITWKLVKQFFGCRLNFFYAVDILLYNEG